MNKKFVICINNKDSDDLQIRKIYQSLPDSGAENRGLLRVIDDSGEDYLYPVDFFVSITLPRAVEKRVFSSPAMAV